MKFHRCCQTKMYRGCTERPQGKWGESRGAHLSFLPVLLSQSITKIWIFSSSNGLKQIGCVSWMWKCFVDVWCWLQTGRSRSRNISLPSQESWDGSASPRPKDTWSIISSNEGRRWKIQSLFCTLSIEKEKTSRRNYFYTLEYHQADLYFVSFWLKRCFTPLFLLEWQFNNVWLNIY